MPARAWTVLVAMLLLFLIFALPAVFLQYLAPGTPQPSTVKTPGGEVWSWGYNDLGELGVGIAGGFAPDGKVADLGSVLDVKAGNEFNVALKPDGTLWAWGLNHRGRLGDGTTEHRWDPIQVSGLDDVAAVSVGELHVVALRRDGTVWTWGGGLHGQLGGGAPVDHQSSPAPVPGLSNMVAVAAGHHHTLALRRDGTVWAWGLNQVGQLGVAGGDDCVGAPCLSTPRRVPDLPPLMALAAGRAHSLAVASDGTAWAWGSNARGQLGDGTTASRPRPAPVTGLPAVSAVVAGAFHSLALQEDGTLWTWGANDEGQLGDGTTEDRELPDRVTLARVRSVASWGNHSLAVRDDGSLWAWGRNYEDQLGVAIDIQACGQTSLSFSTAPLRVPGYKDVIAVATSGVHSLAATASRQERAHVLADPRRIATLTAVGVRCDDTEPT